MKYGYLNYFYSYIISQPIAKIIGYLSDMYRIVLKDFLGIND